MKSVLFLAFLLPILAKAQNPFNFPLDSTTGRISYSQVIDLPKKSKDDIYKSLKLWIAKEYVNPKEVVNVDDPETGILLLKPSFVIEEINHGKTFDMKTYLRYNYDMKILLKDGKIKVTISDIVSSMRFDNDPYNKPTPVEKPFLFPESDKEQMQYYDYRKKMADNLKTHITDRFESIKKYLTQKSEMEF
jgi:hypothetical protein